MVALCFNQQTYFFGAPHGTNLGPSKSTGVTGFKAARSLHGPQTTSAKDRNTTERRDVSPESLEDLP